MGGSGCISRYIVSTSSLITASMLAASITFMPVGQAVAQTISGTTNATQVLGAAGVLVVQGTGEITGVNTGADVTNVTATSITNDGQINGTTDAIVVQTSADVSGGITNSGTIDGGYGIHVSTSSDISGGVTNQSGGTISGVTAVLIENSSDLSGGITNSGTISGTNYGIEVINSSDVLGGIVNSGTISGATAIFASSSSIMGGITNTGTINGTGGTAINLVNLGGAAPININGGRIIGDVIDDAPANGFSVVTVGGDFVTEGDFNVSDLTVSAGNVLTISAGDTVTLNSMSASAGTISFEVDSTASFGTLVVGGGGIDLTGATVSVSVGAGNIADGDELMIADGAAAIVGGPGGILTSITDNSFLWNFEIADGTAAAAATDNTDLFLFVRQGNTISGSASTSGNGAAGNVLMSLSGTSNPGIQSLLSAINLASSQEDLNNILEAVQPAVDGAAIVGALNVSKDTMRITGSRLNAIRMGEPETGVAAGDVAKGVRVWGQFFGTKVDQGRRQDVGGFDTNTAGLAIGMDTENISDDAVVGIAVSYGRTNADSKSANFASTDVDSYQLTLYGDHDVDKRTYISGMLSYSYHNNDTSRIPVAGLVANGDYSANQYAVRAEVGREFSYMNTLLTPSLMGYWTHYDPESYIETGAGGAGLRVEGDSLDILDLGIGIMASWEKKLDSGAYLNPEIHARYSYDVIGDDISMTSQFLGGGSAFRSQGFDPAQSAFDIGAGFKYFEAGDWEFMAVYDFEYKSDYTAHSGFLRAARKL